VNRGGGKIRKDNARRPGTTAGQAAKQDDEKRRYNKEKRQGKTVKQSEMARRDGRARHRNERRRRKKGRQCKAGGHGGDARRDDNARQVCMAARQDDTTMQGKWAWRQDKTTRQGGKGSARQRGDARRYNKSRRPGKTESQCRARNRKEWQRGKTVQQINSARQDGPTR
jgi:hypothetical protein